MTIDVSQETHGRLVELQRRAPALGDSVAEVVGLLSLATPRHVADILADAAAEAAAAREGER